MIETDFWWWLLPLALLPVFFAMGWFAARVDMRTVLKQAKTVPTGFYKSLAALVDRKTDVAADALSEVLRQEPHSYELHLTLGKLYRQRGENDKAIRLHQALLASPDLIGDKREEVLFELGQDFQTAGLVDRAEGIFKDLVQGNAAKVAREELLNIYQQDRDWEKAIETASHLSHDELTYQFEIAQFYCELAQTALFQSNFEKAKNDVYQALIANRKCTRANMILGDIYLQNNDFQSAIDAYSAIEKQNHVYLSMVGERLFDAYDGLNKGTEGLAVLVGYMKTFPQLDLIDVIYEKALLLQGEQEAAELILDLVRMKPDLKGTYRLLGLRMSDLDLTWRADADMVRQVVGRYAQKALVYRCRHCHFKSQVFFWHCPACNKWETFTPNKIEV